MANTVVNPTWVVNESAERFMSSVKGIPAMNRTYDDSFRVSGAKVGSTVLARLPQQWSVRRGQAWSPQAIYDRTMPISLSYQTGVDFDYSSASGTTELDRIRERYVNPAADTLAADADGQAMADIYTSFYNSVGTPGTVSATNLLYLQAVNKIFEGSGDTDSLKAVLGSAAMAALVNNNVTQFNPSGNIGGQFKKGLVSEGQLGIGQWFRDQHVPRHTTGTFTACSPTVNGANQTGSTLVTQAWASGATTLKKGDILTLAGVYSVNPLSKVNTGLLQQFVVTADTADSAGAIAALPISPSIITSGAYQTVSASPANSAAITVWSTAAATALATTVAPQGLILAPYASVFAMADLVEPVGGADNAFARSRDYNMSMRFVRQYDIKSDQNGHRLDIMWGASPLEVWQACRVQG